MKIVADSVLAFVFRRDRSRRRFLLMKRTPDRGGFWQSMSGRAKKRESAEETAERETREETGLKPMRLVTIDYINAFYDLGDVHVEPCFGVEVGAGKVRLSREHTEHRWLDAKGALRLLRWPGNRAGLAILIDELRA
jgi:8-oxo-dGTP pyrophosphatase MutT (NUDIX family)